MAFLSPDHFLSLPRPDLTAGQPTGVVDTSTLAAHDFDVDTRTGFLPPQPPLSRLPVAWEPWETILDNAQERKLQLGDKLNLADDDISSSASWRAHVSQVSILPTEDIRKSELLLRRAHHVLSFIMHIYVHSLPPDADIRIPASITIPLLQVCAQLQLPPMNTYTDNVLYNWTLKTPSPSGIPTLQNLRTQTVFSGTKDEEEFYLTSARIELRGVEALELMRATMDEAFVGDAIAFRRITTYLQGLSRVIAELKDLLLACRENCDPDVFYRDIRPWFRGADSDPRKRKWVFEGLEDHPELDEPTELSGPSAGQSPLVHALDIFLGVDQYSDLSPSPGSSTSANKLTFLMRMQSYMSRHHRNFLHHLSVNPRPLRTLVTNANDLDLLEAYNTALQSLKEFRDAHMIIVALYIIGPAKRMRAGAPKGVEDKVDAAKGVDNGKELLKGTGGTDLVKFLKGVRDRTKGALINHPTGEDNDVIS